ncbi:Uncharacterised protein [Raoultella ornithinolytica]|uniref:hypothetical protein n=1 Tax=Raoultella ornithinolytica TaxID=54291 RepID=UPI0007CBC650|nr:hypothetical protein [Raoultella ornithinolytica]SAQ38665.1 Uncharacterised protein [Raoultella ornithinolytica]
MNNKTFVRTLLVDSQNKQFIKSLDERSLDSYIELLSKENKTETKYTIIDFSPVIEYFHIEIELALKTHKNEEMKIHHATTFNNWLRFKDIPSDKESIIFDQAIKIMDDTEKTINLVMASLSKSKSNYYSTTNHERDNLLNTIINDSAIFIESILCQIHAGIIFSPTMIQKSITIPQHLVSVLSKLQDLLREEAGVNPNLTLNHNNIIEQACIENNLGIDPYLIINLTNANFSVEDIIKKIFSSPIKDIPNYGNNLMHRERVLIWTKASTEKTRRTILISEKIKKILSIIGLVDKIKNSDYEFSRNSDDIENISLQLEILSKNS